MGRANLLSCSGGIFHVTHRCHNRAFLLKFARDREAYREMLRQQLGRFKLWLLDYCLTSNHVHLLIDAEDRMEVSAFR
jgi:putative transposase